MNQGIMQSHATEKIQKIQQQHPDMQQRYFSLQLQEEHKRQSEKVPKPEEAKKNEIDSQQERDREQKGREKDGRRPGRAEDDHNTEGDLRPEQGAHHIDIKA
jgi:hypothetical protein